MGPLGGLYSSQPGVRLTKASGAKHNGSHERLLAIHNLSGRVCCGRSRARCLLSAPPRLFIKCVTGHVSGGGQAV